MWNHLPDVAYRVAIDRHHERIRRLDRGRPLHDEPPDRRVRRRR